MWKLNFSLFSSKFYNIKRFTSESRIFIISVSKVCVVVKILPIFVIPKLLKNAINIKIII